MTALAPADSEQVNPMSKTQILIVDDHPVVRQGLRLALARYPELEICGEADGEDVAIQQFRALSPDLVVADISLNNGSGLELIKELKALQPASRILIWSMHDETLFAERAIRAGAMGFVNKTEPIETVIAAIERIIVGKVYVSEQMTERMISRTMGSGTNEVRTPMESLSDRELEVFQEIGHGVTTRQIAAKLGLSPKTVETYRENIKSKLKLANATELTRHAVQWVLENQ